MSTTKKFGAALIALCAGLTLASTPAQAAPPKRTVSLILDYSVAKSCTVYPNYPKSGVVGNGTGWTIAPGDTVAWRFNINSTYAMISDKKYRKTGHPWWGITRRSCIGTSLGGEHFPTENSTYPAGKAIPQRLLSGRSGVTKSHYRSVDFSPAAASPVVNPHKAITSFGTLRDARGRFVIGNVNKGWHVRTTSVTDGAWTKIYVPNAKRWGWIENIHL